MQSLVVHGGIGVPWRSSKVQGCPSSGRSAFRINCGRTGDSKYKIPHALGNLAAKQPSASSEFSRHGYVESRQTIGKGKDGLTVELKQRWEEDRHFLSLLSGSPFIEFQQIFFWGTANPLAQTYAQDGPAYRERIAYAIDLLEKGQIAQAEGDYSKALDFYGEVKEKAGDLALAEYARVGHAVSLYEIGDRNDAIIEMEDVAVALRGYPEIHAALAAALYVDKHAPLPAEKQFNIATLLDPRYTNVKWVETTKHWPPSLISSLKRFITLQ